MCYSDFAYETYPIMELIEQKPFVVHQNIKNQISNDKTHFKWHRMWIAVKPRETIIGPVHFHKGRWYWVKIYTTFPDRMGFKDFSSPAKES